MCRIRSVSNGRSPFSIATHASISWPASLTTSIAHWPAGARTTGSARSDGSRTSRSRPNDIRELMPLTCCVTHGSILARTDLLRAAGGYRPDLSPQEDYDLWLRLLPRANFTKLPEPLYQYRVHDTQASAQGKPHNIRTTIGIKLAYLRRVCPWLPTPARLAIAGTGRGVGYYNAVARDFQFVPAPTPPSANGWDVLVDDRLRRTRCLPDGVQHSTRSDAHRELLRQ